MLSVQLSVFSSRSRGTWAQHSWRGAAGSSPRGQYVPGVWLTVDGSNTRVQCSVSPVDLPSRVPLGAWQSHRLALSSFYLYQPLSTHVHNRKMLRLEIPKQSSGVVVSPKEVFMNAAAAFPQSRSALCHQTGWRSYPHSLDWYHFTLSFQGWSITPKNIHAISNSTEIRRCSTHSRCDV